MALRSHASLTAVLFFAVLAGCSVVTEESSAPDHASAPMGNPSAAPSARPNAAAPAGVDDETWKSVRALSPGVMPPAAPDPSNAWADDPKAAALGEQLFAEAGFAGPMLDIDNDGSSRSLGVRGTSGKVACSGCHTPDKGFLDERSVFRELSLGTGWTARRTPSLLDIGQASVVTWAGRRSTLYSQVFGPFENPLEMNTSRLFVAQVVAKKYAAEYESLFGAGSLAPLANAARFPTLTADTTGCRLTRSEPHPRALPPDPLYTCRGMPGDGADYDAMALADQDLVTRVVVNVGKAIGAYERLLVCGTGRFDAWVQGDATALSAAEQRGVRLFVGKAKCVTCHSGPYLSDQRFHNVGLQDRASRIGIFDGIDRGAAVDLPLGASDPVGIGSAYSDGNDGRMSAMAGAALEGAFRTPPLRCAAKRPSFMRSGALHTLEEVVAFFNRGGDAHGTFAGTKELSPLGLSADEEADLVAFLRALDGSAPVPTFKH